MPQYEHAFGHDAANPARRPRALHALGVCGSRFDLPTESVDPESRRHSEAEAIKKVLDGLALPVDDSLEYIEVAEDFGLPTDEYMDLADELRALGVPVGEAVIPSIRSVERVDG